MWKKKQNAIVRIARNSLKRKTRKEKQMSSTLIETININADDFTDNFLTCPTCIGPYDENEHAPKLLPCSHTLCRSCLERIASSAMPVNNLNLASVMNAAVASGSGGGGGGGGSGSGGGGGGASGSGSSQQTSASNQLNSISRSVAAADAAHAALNGSSSTSNNQSPYLASNMMYHLNNMSSSSTSTINTIANNANGKPCFLRRFLVILLSCSYPSN